jgi:flagellar assembly factor FliW
MIVETKYFGAVDSQESAIIKFPLGLPGFEALTDFLCLEQPALRPLAYLQSVSDPQICFLTLPVRVIEPSYEVEIGVEEARLLNLGPALPRIGSDIACLAILCIGPDQVASANLAAPVVINISERIALQVLQTRSGHDCAHPLERASAVRIAC